MKYENAKYILPNELFEELQKYAAGKLLYVPSSDEKRNWGEASGYREKLQKRNLMICNKYANGITISELADEYFLSLDSIKKIIYSRKSYKQLEYSATLKTAIEYSNAGMSEEWIHSYLLFTCNSYELSKHIMESEYLYYGVVKLPLRLVQTEGLDDFHSAKLEEYGETTTDFSPLLIQYEKGKFHTLVQSELFLALKKRKVNAYPAFILINGSDNYKSFMKHYGTPLIHMDKI